MLALLEMLVWVLTMLPMLAVSVHWARRSHKRSRLLIEALSAIAGSVLIAFAIGAGMPSAAPYMYVVIPFMLGGVAMVMSLNRAGSR